MAHTDIETLSHDEVSRYSRHLLLGEVGVAGQERLKAASVLVVGAGGLGSPLLLYLAAAGVGRLGIVDDDAVEQSNLQRQVVHCEASVGAPKVASAAARIAELNPLVQVEAIPQRLTAENAPAVLRGYDVVVDGSDSFKTKYVVDDACVAAGVPCVYGAVMRFEGHCSVFNHPPGVGPTYRDYMPRCPNADDAPSCADAGVLGVVPGIVGCVQATEVVKLLLGIGEPLAGRVLLYDALEMAFRTVRLGPRQRRGRGAASTAGEPAAAADPESAAAACAACRSPAPAAAAADDAPFARIGCAAAAARRADDGWAPFVLDVRLPQEAAISRLPFADALLPHRGLLKRLGEGRGAPPEVPRDRDVLVHCRTGLRSEAVCRALAAAGFERVFNLDGGINGWAAEVDGRLAQY